MELNFFNIFFGKEPPNAMPQSSVPKGKQPAVNDKNIPKGAPPVYQHPTYTQPQYNNINKTEKLEQPPSSIKTFNAPSDREKFETELILSLLISYFDIVKKNVKDLVPKSIMYFLVNASKDAIQNELVSQLYREDLFDSLLEESSSIASKRNAAKSLLDMLRKCHEILNEVRDYNPVVNAKIDNSRSNAKENGAATIIGNMASMALANQNHAKK